MFDKDKGKSKRNQDAINNDKLKQMNSFGTDSIPIYQKQISNLDRERRLREEAGYSGAAYDTGEKIKDVQSKLDSYKNKKFLTAEQATQKQEAVMNRKKGGIVKTKKK